MPTQTPTRARRWADVLCAPCQDTILDNGWTIDLRPCLEDERDLADLFDCSDCYTAVDAHLEADGDLRPFYRLRLDRLMLTAIHEAAHARVGQALGAEVTAVQLECDRAGRPIPGGGGQTLVPNIAQLPTLDSVTIYWAGQEANLRWLAQRRPMTHADRLDLRFLGWHDIERALTMIRRTKKGRAVRAELRRGQARADDLLDEHWHSIVDLAVELSRTGCVEF